MVYIKIKFLLCKKRKEKKKKIQIQLHLASYCINLAILLKNGSLQILVNLKLEVFFYNSKSV